MATIKIHLLSLLLLFACVESAPVQDASQTNPTARYEQPWVSGPSRRGTLDILFACILTLLLCVWTTVHTNIEPKVWQRGRIIQRQGEPEGSASPQTATVYEVLSPVSTPGFGPPTIAQPPPMAQQSPPPARFGVHLNKRKMVWSLVTLLFPEIALFVAAHERKTANLLLAEMGTISKYIGYWDMTLSYYAVMGGFVVEPKNSGVDVRQSFSTRDEKYMSGVSTDGIQSITSNTDWSQIGQSQGELERRCTLTPRGVLYLASSGKLPYFSAHMVKDKSKANLLAKFLICFQAIWMIIQIIGRYASKLPVTLLELYTVLHTFCAVAMYLIWIDKPFDITEPTFIELPQDILRDLAENVRDKPEDLTYHNPTNVFWNHDYSNCLTTRAGLGKLLFRQLWDWNGFKEGEILGNFILLLGAYTALWNGWRKFGWEALGLSFVGMAHGGLHLVAWNFDFPSPTESKLWKIASLLTAAAVAIFCFSVLLGFLVKLVWEGVRKKINNVKNENEIRARGGQAYDNDDLRGWKRFIEWLDKSRVSLKWWFMTIYCIGFVLAIAPCILARLYLLVESFASMRQLPSGSYDKVVWVNFIPHVG